GMPIVAPFDLSACADAWSRELESLDLHNMPAQRDGRTRTSSIIRVGDHFVNRLGRTRVPVAFPVTDDFLYVIGLWLAAGGNSAALELAALAFSLGGTPAAADTLLLYFAAYRVTARKSPANEFDYAVTSSLFEAVFHHLGLFGTAKRGNKRTPPFFW